MTTYYDETEQDMYTATEQYHGYYETIGKPMTEEVHILVSYDTIYNVCQNLSAFSNYKDALSALQKAEQFHDEFTQEGKQFFIDTIQLKS